MAGDRAEDIRDGALRDYTIGSCGTFLKTSGGPTEIFQMVDGENGFSTVNKFGRNEDIDGTDEDIWTVGGTLTYLAAAEAMDLTSSNNADVGTVEVQGLDGTYAMLTENVVLTGTVASPTTGSFLRVFRMLDISDGGPQGTSQLGSITATSKSASTIQAQIEIGDSQTLMTHYTIPAGKSAYMTRWAFAVDKTAAGAEIDFELYVRPEGGVFNLKKHQGLTTTAQSFADDEFYPYLKIAEKSDIRCTSKSSSTNADVHVSYDMFLRTN